MNRRTFLRKTTTAAAFGLGAAALPASAWSRPVGANDAINVAIAGLNFGRSHVNRLHNIPGVRVTALCDLDPATLQSRVEDLRRENLQVFATTEFRRVLERSDVDAVVIATPNHWHALHTIWACQAGKDVYVEKPVSQNIWEGQKMIEAAARHNRIVQAGTQGRSARGLAELIDYLKSGEIGAIQYGHAYSFRHRPGIGKRLPWYPDNLDYDMFCGRAPMAPIERDRMHYDWHWMWETGNGDLGNLGIHVFDRARWVSGQEGPPPRMISLGQRYNVDDAGETPNAQLTLCAYPEFPIIIENRSLPRHADAGGPDELRGLRSGIVVQCEGGYFAGMNGGEVFDNEGRLIREFPQGGNHMLNFIEAVRSRKSEDLNARIDVAHASNIGCLGGNISYRIGHEASSSEIREQLANVLPSGEILESFEDYLSRYGIDLERNPLQLGRWIDFDPASDEITAVPGGDDSVLDRARFLLKGTHRAPYQIPDNI